MEGLKTLLVGLEMLMIFPQFEGFGCACYLEQTRHPEPLTPLDFSAFVGPLRYPDTKARGLQVPAFLLMTSQQIGRLQRVLEEAEGRNPAAVDAGTNSFHKSASGPAVPLEYHCSLFRMRVKDLTPKQFLSVPCSAPH